MNNLTNLIINDILVLILFYFLIPYLKEKGKNLATKEDIQKITADVEKVKSFYEEGRIKLEKELDSTIEIMKSKLKTTEIYFKKQLEALEEFSKIFRKIFPKYDSPFKEWEDACFEIIYKLNDIETLLNKFLDKYEIYLPENTTKLLENIISSTIDAQMYLDDNKDTDIDIGNSILKDLQEAKKSFINEIKNNILFSSNSQTPP